MHYNAGNNDKKNTFQRYFFNLNKSWHETTAVTTKNFSKSSFNNYNTNSVL